MERDTKIIMIAGLSILFLLAWAPWITGECAKNKVIKHLGADTPYGYLSEIIPVKDIPMEVSWFPFVRFVYFPGEALYFVTFYGGVLP